MSEHDSICWWVNEIRRVQDVIIAYGFECVVGEQNSTSFVNKFTCIGWALFGLCNLMIMWIEWALEKQLDLVKATWLNKN